jgi:hypothetical protein
MLEEMASLQRGRKGRGRQSQVWKRKQCRHVWRHCTKQKSFAPEGLKETKVIKEEGRTGDKKGVAVPLMDDNL